MYNRIKNQTYWLIVTMIFSIISIVGIKESNAQASEIPPDCGDGSVYGCYYQESTQTIFYSDGWVAIIG